MPIYCYLLIIVHIFVLSTVINKIALEPNHRATLIGMGLTRSDRQQALKLRLSGNSYAQITRKLGMSKSTLSGWFSNLELPQTAKAKLKQRVHDKSVKGLLKRNKLETQKAISRASNIRTSSRLEILPLNSEMLKMIGTSLYWAEGYKRPIVRNGKTKTYHPVTLTNSDPYLVKLFLRFLRETCAVPEEKIKASMRIYEHQNEGHLLEFWARATRIPPSRFGKFYYGVSKSSLGKRPYKILPYGTIQITVSDTALYHKIMGWIEGLAEL